VRFVVERMALEHLCSRTSVLTCYYHSTNAAYSFSSALCSYQKDKRAKHGTLPKKKEFFIENRGSLLKKYFLFSRLSVVKGSWYLFEGRLDKLQSHFTCL
jgi:hypothetical protein